ncbi:MAG: LD-carboxypeptidase [Burkholderiaceae bacterium]|jgi:muramoyltetrapeptide carboxypeptidase
MSAQLIIHAPAGALTSSAPAKRAARRLRDLGYAVSLDPSVGRRQQRFAGTDEERLATLHRVAQAAPSVAMAARGGYGMTRLLDRLDWALLARSVEQGTRWVGYSDLTALQCGLLAHQGCPSWHGPMAAEDFGRSTYDDDDHREQNETTVACFQEAMDGSLEAVGFRTESGFDGLGCRGTLWGGNLTMVCSLLGTPHWPQVRKGILFLEDVGEHPYRVERMLLQLLQAGVLGRQKAVLLGKFSDWKPSPLDRGYTLSSAVGHLRQHLDIPVLTGFPFGHTPLKVTVPVGVRVDLTVQGRDALVAWDHGHS